MDDPDTVVVGDVILGANYASDPEEFLKKFDAEMRDKSDDDAFTLKKSYPVSTLSATTGRTKYNAPEGVDGAKSKSVPAEYSAYDLYALEEPPYNLNKLVRVGEKSVPHYAAVDVKVSNITQLGYKLIEAEYISEGLAEKSQSAKKKAQKRIRDAKRATQKWLESLTGDEGILEMLEKVMTDYYYTGNAYIEIGRSVTGSIGFIGHVPSTTMRVRKARDGYVQIVGDKVTFFKPFMRDVKNPIKGGDSHPNEIIHIKKYSPLSGYYGVPEIIVAMTAVAGTELAQRYNLDYFQNKATPRYVIVMKGGNLSETAQKRVAEFFETGVKGSNHRSIYIPLPADTQEAKVSFEMKPVEAGVQEASFEKYIKMNNSFILMSHRVPVSKVGLAEGVSLAVARDADKTFSEQVIRPMQSRLEEKLNKILHSDNTAFDFRFNELSLSDEDTQSKIHERYLKVKTITPNEVRAERGLPPIEGGDKPIELNARQAADARANTMQNRERDSERSAASSDSAGEARQPKGEGAASQ